MKKLILEEIVSLKRLDFKDKNTKTTTNGR